MNASDAFLGSKITHDMQESRTYNTPSNYEMLKKFSCLAVIQFIHILDCEPFDFMIYAALNR